MRKTKYLLILAFVFAGIISCSDDNVGEVIDPNTQILIEKGLEVPAIGCDTTIVFPFSKEGYQVVTQYENNSNKWCHATYSAGRNSDFSIVRLRVLPSDTNLVARKSELRVISIAGTTYEIKITQAPRLQAYAEDTLYLVPASGGMVNLKIKTNVPVTGYNVERLVGLREKTHFRSYDWLGGIYRTYLIPDKNNTVVFNAEIALNTGLGRNVFVYCVHYSADSLIRSNEIEIRQAPRELHADETYIQQEALGEDPLDVIFGTDKNNLAHLRNVNINADLFADDIDYLTELVQSYSLKSLDLSHSELYGGASSKYGKDYEKNTIPERMFFGSTCFEIVIPDNITSIEDEAFATSKNLASFTLPKTVRRIGARAFALCSNLKNIVIPKESSLFSIYDEAFNTDSELENLYLPATIGYLSKQALKGLQAKKLHVGWSTPPILTIGFVTKGCTLYVPKGSVEKYKAADIWKDCDAIIEEP